MSNPTLDLQSIELVSTLHTAPANGAPVSADYYDGELEKVTDLASIADFINSQLLPLLNVLPAAAADGLQGTAIYSDTVNQDQLVFDPSTGNPLTVTASMRVLYGQLQTIKTALTNVTQQVTSLQARLSASNQDDVSLALQSVTSSLAQSSTQIQALSNSLSSLQLIIGIGADVSLTTGAITAGSTANVEIDWATAFADNTYVVSYSLEDSSGTLQIVGYSYLSAGAGITLYVRNTGSSTQTGTVHVTGRTAIG